MACFAKAGSAHTVVVAWLSVTVSHTLYPCAIAFAGGSTPSSNAPNSSLCTARPSRSISLCSPPYSSGGSSPWSPSR